MSMWHFFLNRNPNEKEINKLKSAYSQQKLAVFSAATDSEIIIIQILHGKGQLKIWTELSSLGQEPTFKSLMVNSGSKHAFKYGKRH